MSCRVACFSRCSQPDSAGKKPHLVMDLLIGYQVGRVWPTKNGTVRGLEEISFPLLMVYSKLVRKEKRDNNHT